MRVSVLGAGAWGTALAIALARAHDIRLWARRAEQRARRGVPVLHATHSAGRSTSRVKMTNAILGRLLASDGTNVIPS